MLNSRIFGTEMDNKGYELTVNFISVRTQDWTWSFSVNTGKVTNKISDNERVNKLEDFLDGSAVINGKSYNTFYSFQYKELSQENGEPLFHNLDIEKTNDFTEFWRRWHISLSSWFKEYVYIPLGGNRKGFPKQIRNILIVWLLTGFWHGASWNFVAWGLYFGVLLIVEKLFLLRFLKKLPAFFQHVYTMLLVMLGWAIFSFDSLGNGIAYIRALFGGYGQPIWDGGGVYLLYTNIALLLIAAVGSTPLPKELWRRLEGRLSAHPIPLGAMETCLVAAGMVLSIAFLVDASYNPFLYFRF